MEQDTEKTRAAWKAFVTTGEVPAGAVRPSTLSAWLRCRAHGVDPRAMKAHSLTPAELATRLDEQRELVDAARPYMHALSLAAGSERHAAMLSDAGGTLLDIVGDEDTAYRTANFPVPGALLSEEFAGANGVGSALAVGSYAELVGPEHFIEGFHIYTCQGLALRAPDGEIVGALSTSVRRLEAAERLHEILVCAAHGIEAEFAMRQLSEITSQATEGGGDEAARLEALRQDVAQLYAAARLRLEHAALVTTRGQAAHELVRTADALIARFRRRSELCRVVALADVSVPRPVELRGRVADVVDLIATEATVKGVAVRVADGPSVHVVSDVRDLTRQVFRALLRAIDAATPSVDLAVDVRAENGRGLVRMTGSTEAELAFPLAEGPS